MWQCQRVSGRWHAKLSESETSDENGKLLVPKSARMVSGRRQHRLRMLVDHLMCRDGRSEESLLERRAVRALAARQNCRTALRTFQKFAKERMLPLVGDVEIDGALVPYPNDCFVQGVQHHMVHSDGSLAVIQSVWVQKTAGVPSMFEVVAAAHTCMHRMSKELQHTSPFSIILTWQRSSSSCL